jgi:hypothetical protein
VSGGTDYPFQAREPRSDVSDVERGDVDTGIIINGTSLESLSAKLEDAVLRGPSTTVSDKDALDLVNVVFALLEKLESVLGPTDYEAFLKDLPNRWSSLE